MSQQPHDANGFPELRREPAPLPELGDHPTPLELARAYAAMALACCRDWPKMVDALHFLYGAVMAVKAELQRGGVPSGGQPIDPDSSYNKIVGPMSEAAQLYYERAKKKGDPLTVADAIAISQGVYARARGDSEARRLARRSERQWAIWLVVLGAVLTVVGEAVLAHYGIHP